MHGGKYPPTFSGYGAAPMGGQYRDPVQAQPMQNQQNAYSNSYIFQTRAQVGNEMQGGITLQPQAGQMGRPGGLYNQVPNSGIRTMQPQMMNQATSQMPGRAAQVIGIPSASQSTIPTINQTTTGHHNFNMGAANSQNIPQLTPELQNILLSPQQLAQIQQATEEMYQLSQLGRLPPDYIVKLNRNIQILNQQKFLRKLQAQQAMGQMAQPMMQPVVGPGVQMQYQNPMFGQIQLQPQMMQPQFNSQLVNPMQSQNQFQFLNQSQMQPQSQLPQMPQTQPQQVQQQPQLADSSIKAKGLNIQFGSKSGTQRDFSQYGISVGPSSSSSSHRPNHAEQTASKFGITAELPKGRQPPQPPTGLNAGVAFGISIQRPQDIGMPKQSPIGLEAPGPSRPTGHSLVVERKGHLMDFGQSKPPVIQASDQTVSAAPALAQQQQQIPEPQTPFAIPPLTIGNVGGEQMQMGMSQMQLNQLSQMQLNQLSQMQLNQLMQQNMMGLGMPMMQEVQPQPQVQQQPAKAPSGEKERRKRKHRSSKARPYIVDPVELILYDYALVSPESFVKLFPDDVSYDYLREMIREIPSNLLGEILDQELETKMSPASQITEEPKTLQIQFNKKRDGKKFKLVIKKSDRPPQRAEPVRLSSENAYSDYTSSAIESNNDSESEPQQVTLYRVAPSPIAPESATPVIQQDRINLDMPIRVLTPTSEIQDGIQKPAKEVPKTASRHRDLAALRAGFAAKKEEPSRIGVPLPIPMSSSDVFGEEEQKPAKEEEKSQLEPQKPEMVVQRPTQVPPEQKIHPQKVVQPPPEEKQPEPEPAPVQAPSPEPETTPAPTLNVDENGDPVVPAPPPPKKRRIVKDGVLIKLDEEANRNIQEEAEPEKQKEQPKPQPKPVEFEPSVDDPFEMKMLPQPKLRPRDQQRLGRQEIIMPDDIEPEKSVDDKYNELFSLVDEKKRHSKRKDSDKKAEKPSEKVDTAKKEEPAPKPDIAPPKRTPRRQQPPPEAEAVPQQVPLPEIKPEQVNKPTPTPEQKQTPKPEPVSVEVKQEPVPEEKPEPLPEVKQEQKEPVPEPVKPVEKPPEPAREEKPKEESLPNEPSWLNPPSEPSWLNPPSEPSWLDPPAEPIDLDKLAKKETKPEPKAEEPAPPPAKSKRPPRRVQKPLEGYTPVEAPTKEEEPMLAPIPEEPKKEEPLVQHTIEEARELTKNIKRKNQFQHPHKQKPKEKPIEGSNENINTEYSKKVFVPTIIPKMKTEVPSPHPAMIDFPLEEPYRPQIVHEVIDWTSLAIGLILPNPKEKTPSVIRKENMEKKKAEALKRHRIENKGKKKKSEFVFLEEEDEGPEYVFLHQPLETTEDGTPIWPELESRIDINAITRELQKEEKRYQTEMAAEIKRQRDLKEKNMSKSKKKRLKANMKKNNNLSVLEYSKRLKAEEAEKRAKEEAEKEKMFLFDKLEGEDDGTAIEEEEEDPFERVPKPVMLADMTSLIEEEDNNDAKEEINQEETSEQKNEEGPIKEAKEDQIGVKEEVSPEEAKEEELVPEVVKDDEEQTQDETAEEKPIEEAAAQEDAPEAEETPTLDQTQTVEENIEIKDQNPEIEEQKEEEAVHEEELAGIEDQNKDVAQKEEEMPSEKEHVEEKQKEAEQMDIDENKEVPNETSEEKIAEEPKDEVPQQDEATAGTQQEEVAALQPEWYAFTSQSGFQYSAIAEIPDPQIYENTDGSYIMQNPENPEEFLPYTPELHAHYFEVVALAQYAAYVTEQQSHVEQVEQHKEQPVEASEKQEIEETVKDEEPTKTADPVEEPKKKKKDHKSKKDDAPVKELKVDIKPINERVYAVDPDEDLIKVPCVIPSIERFIDPEIFELADEELIEELNKVAEGVRSREETRRKKDYSRALQKMLDNGKITKDEMEQKLKGSNIDNMNLKDEPSKESKKKQKKQQQEKSKEKPEPQPEPTPQPKPDEKQTEQANTARKMQPTPEQPNAAPEQKPWHLKRKQQPAEPQTYEAPKQQQSSTIESGAPQKRGLSRWLSHKKTQPSELSTATMEAPKPEHKEDPKPKPESTEEPIVELKDEPKEEKHIEEQIVDEPIVEQKEEPQQPKDEEKETIIEESKEEHKIGDSSESNMYDQPDPEHWNFNIFEDLYVVAPEKAEEIVFNVCPEIYEEQINELISRAGTGAIQIFTELNLEDFMEDVFTPAPSTPDEKELQTVEAEEPIEEPKERTIEGKQENVEEPNEDLKELKETMKEEPKENIEKPQDINDNKQITANAETEKNIEIKEQNAVEPQMKEFKDSKGVSYYALREIEEPLYVNLEDGSFAFYDPISEQYIPDSEEARAYYFKAMASIQVQQQSEETSAEATKKESTDVPSPQFYEFTDYRGFSYQSIQKIDEPQIESTEQGEIMYDPFTQQWIQHNDEARKYYYDSMSASIYNSYISLYSNGGTAQAEEQEAEQEEEKHEGKQSVTPVHDDLIANQEEVHKEIEENKDYQNENISQTLEYVENEEIIQKEENDQEEAHGEDNQEEEESHAERNKEEVIDEVKKEEDNEGANGEFLMETHEEEIHIEEVHEEEIQIEEVHEEENNKEKIPEEDTNHEEEQKEDIQVNVEQETTEEVPKEDVTQSIEVSQEHISEEEKFVVEDLQQKEVNQKTEEINNESSSDKEGESQLDEMINEVSILKEEKEENEQSQEETKLNGEAFGVVGIINNDKAKENIDKDDLENTQDEMSSPDLHEFEDSRGNVYTAIERIQEPNTKNDEYGNLLLFNPVEEDYVYYTDESIKKYYEAMAELQAQEYREIKSHKDEEKEEVQEVENWELTTNKGKEEEKVEQIKQEESEKEIITPEVDQPIEDEVKKVEEEGPIQPKEETNESEQKQEEVPAPEWKEFVDELGQNYAALYEIEEPQLFGDENGNQLIFDYFSNQYVPYDVESRRRYFEYNASYQYQQYLDQHQNSTEGQPEENFSAIAESMLHMQEFRDALDVPYTALSPIDEPEVGEDEEGNYVMVDPATQQTVVYSDAARASYFQYMSTVQYSQAYHDLIIKLREEAAQKLQSEKAKDEEPKPSEEPKPEQTQENFSIDERETVKEEEEKNEVTPDKAEDEEAQKHQEIFEEAQSEKNEEEMPTIRSEFDSIKEEIVQTSVTDSEKQSKIISRGSSHGEKFRTSASLSENDEAKDDEARKDSPEMVEEDDQPESLDEETRERLIDEALKKALEETQRSAAEESRKRKEEELTAQLRRESNESREKRAAEIKKQIDMGIQKRDYELRMQFAAQQRVIDEAFKSVSAQRRREMRQEVKKIEHSLKRESNNLQKNALDEVANREWLLMQQREEHIKTLQADKQKKFENHTKRMRSHLTKKVHQRMDEENKYCERVHQMAIDITMNSKKVSQVYEEDDIIYDPSFPSNFNMIENLWEINPKYVTENFPEIYMMDIELMTYNMPQDIKDIYTNENQEINMLDEEDIQISCNLSAAFDKQFNDLEEQFNKAITNLHDEFTEIAKKKLEEITQKKQQQINEIKQQYNEAKEKADAEYQKDLEARKAELEQQIQQRHEEDQRNYQSLYEDALHKIDAEEDEVLEAKIEEMKRRISGEYQRSVTNKSIIDYEKEEMMNQLSGSDYNSADLDTDDGEEDGLTSLIQLSQSLTEEYQSQEEPHLSSNPNEAEQEEVPPKEIRFSPTTPPPRTFSNNSFRSMDSDDYAELREDIKELFPGDYNKLSGPRASSNSSVDSIDTIPDNFRKAFEKGKLERQDSLIIQKSDIGDPDDFDDELFDYIMNDDDDDDGDLFGPGNTTTDISFESSSIVRPGKVTALKVERPKEKKPMTPNERMEQAKQMLEADPSILGVIIEKRKYLRMPSGSTIEVPKGFEDIPDEMLIEQLMDEGFEGVNVEGTEDDLLAEMVQAEDLDDFDDGIDLRSKISNGIKSSADGVLTVSHAGQEIKIELPNRNKPIEAK